MTKHREPRNHISDRIIQLCESTDSVSSLIAHDPDLAPGDAWERLYGGRALKAAGKEARKNDSGDESAGSEPLTQDELERAARCGKWGPTKPSELFLKVTTPKF
jgi:hypothetical protein